MKRDFSISLFFVGILLVGRADNVELLDFDQDEVLKCEYLHLLS